MASSDSGRDRVNRSGTSAELLAGHGVAERGPSVTDRPVEWLTVFGERLGDVLVYSSAYLAFVAMAEVLIVTVLLGLPASPAPVVVGLVTFSVYAIDRLEDADTDAMTDPRQVAFVRRHGGLLYTLAAAAYGLAVAVSVLGGPLALAITVLPGVFWVLYASSWIPDVGIHVRRLKELLVVNSSVVALAWAVCVTFLPIAFTGAAVTPTVVLVFAYFFLGTFVNVEIPNVRDMEGDRAIGVATLPLAIGVERTRQALYGIDGLIAALVWFAVLGGYLSVGLAAALFVGLAYSLAVTAFVGRYGDGRLLTIAAESEYVVVALALVPVVYVA